MQLKSNNLIGFIVILFAVLAIFVSLVVPVFEAPDESAHYLHADFIARTGQLPTLNYADPHDEYHQPPLYYWFNAGWIRLIGLPDPAPFLRPNPNAAISDTASFANKNAYQHNFAAESWPWRGTVLALQLGRFTSILLGMLTVWLAYLIACVVFPKRPALALAVAAVVAFNPQFIFISASLNNDNLTTLLVTLSVWLALHLNQKHRLTWVHGLLAGGLIGLAILSKPTGWIGGLGLGGLFFWRFVSVRSRSTVFALAVFGITPLVVAGWWLYRNQLLYQDWLLRGYMLAYLKVDAAQLVSPLFLLQKLQEAEVSFWATFGWLNITLADQVYLVYRWLVRLAFVGVIFGFVRAIWLRRLNLPGLGWPVAIVLLTVAGMVVTMWQWVALAGGIQGRLLFPIVVPLALLIVWGWSELVGSKAVWLGVAYLFGVALYALIFVLRPTYGLPATYAELPSTATPSEIHFAEGIRLVGYSQPTALLEPGLPFALTLYWQATKAVTKPYAVFIHAIDETGLIVAQTQGFAGRGLISADQWPLNQMLADRHKILLPGLTFAPSEGHFVIGLYDPDSGERLALANGRQTAQLSPFSIAPTTGPYDVNWPVDFEQGVALLGYDLSQRTVAADDEVEVVLHWQTSQPFSKNYTIFVHLLDEAGNRVAQHDSWPDNGAAPTKAWPLNQPIADKHPLKMPPVLTPGAYQLWIGLYDGKSGERIRLASSEALFGADALPLVQLKSE